MGNNQHDEAFQKAWQKMFHEDKKAYEREKIDEGIEQMAYFLMEQYTALKKAGFKDKQALDLTTKIAETMVKGAMK